MQFHFIKLEKNVLDKNYNPLSYMLYTAQYLHTILILKTRNLLSWIVHNGKCCLASCQLAVFIWFTMSSIYTFLYVSIHTHNRQKCVNENQHVIASQQSSFVTVWKWKIWHLLSLLFFDTALLLVPDMLVSCVLIMNRYTGSLHCHPLSDSGLIQSLLQWALWALLLHEALHLP